ncbi:peptidase [Microbacterium sp. Marseille-Q6965]|uniref:peptidase n=1 Tax=Microbacterium sp. Marseille-Q6965 TaxID=2965072 RepID=UPI0021B6F79D|nr:peptidase [Microbacterium sp. Marseille-Q6965]
MTIDWLAFVQVFFVALIAGVLVVGFYALGLRLLARSGRTPVVAPAVFTDAIRVMTPKQIAKAQKQADKAARRSPLTSGEKTVALIGAYACFAVVVLAVVGGILLIVLG